MKSSLTLTARLVPRMGPPSEPAPQGRHDILVLCTLKNVGKTTIVFGEWGCSWYANWSTNTPKLRIEGWPCSANMICLRTLAPGQAHQKVVPFRFFNTTQGERLSFKMRFLSSREHRHKAENVSLESAPLSIMVL
ncbi:hypothetical protein [Armatimonas sp.]|uniref:hypothetical protein n=1 Tax=Armatimonas sp. TaxID=1872638 RepID=UPI003751A86F